MTYDKSTSLIGVVAIGVALGAVASAQDHHAAQVADRDPAWHRHGRHRHGHDDGDLGCAGVSAAGAGRVAVGFFVVPMNALLQHRGHVLMSAGHSIAVQNFNENLSILTMLAAYSLMLRGHLNLDIIILLFGMFLAGTMFFIMRKHQANQREFDSVSLIGEAKH
jgi:LPLT family lysophospholipid transporter-like MFS transporter